MKIFVACFSLVAAVSASPISAQSVDNVTLGEIVEVVNNFTRRCNKPYAFRSNSSEVKFQSRCGSYDKGRFQHWLPCLATIHCTNDSTVTCADPKHPLNSACEKFIKSLAVKR